MNRYPVLIDTDSGLDHTFINTLGLYDFINLDYTVFKGATQPIIIKHQDKSTANGEKVKGDYIWDAIYNLAIQYKGKLSMIALGPLTNIAIALLKYPDLPQYIKKLLIMGGSSQWGNTEPYSEFNFWYDPHAAEIVLQSGMNMQMIGLNITKQILLTEKRGAVAVAAFINPSIFEFEKHYVTCITDKGRTQGWSIIDTRKQLNEVPNIEVAVKVDQSQFLKTMEDFNMQIGGVQ